MERQGAIDTEKLLAMAGFEMRPADNDERRQDLANMPPRRIIAHRQGGQTVFTYADAQNCGCLYVGGLQAYQEYRRLALSEAIAQDTSEVSLNPAYSTMKWGLWGSSNPRLDPDDDSAIGFPL
jgi:hypothetical protein